MLPKLFLPFILLILLRNIVFLDELADAVKKGFERDYTALRCGRQDVYVRNLKDSFLVLASRYRYLSQDVLEASDNSPDADCQGADFSVFRELNGQLPAIYPNWLYREVVEPIE